MHTDPDFYDVRIAGWWVWGLCQWIGGGWCVEPNNHKHPKLDGIGKGVHSQRGFRDRQRPKMSGDSAGMGVHAPRGRRSSEADWRKRPELDGTSPGRGVHSDGAHEPRRQLPDLSVTGNKTGSVGNGKGIHGGGFLRDAYSTGPRPRMSDAGLPSLGNDRGLNGVAAAPCVDWFRALQARLRRVRVACGDWKRVLGNSVLGKGKNVGGRRPCAVFLDPPYSFEFRDPYLYSEDDAAISAQVREWALEHGDDPDLRIAICGYEGEHEMPPSWRKLAWKASRGYASEENENRKLERVWFSPFCLKPAQTELFAEAAE